MEGHRIELEEPALGLISAKMAKALSSTWRCRIISALSVRPLSPSEFVDEVGGDLSSISRCFRQLAEWDYVEVVEERTGGRRRGATEKVYRKTKAAHYDTPTWEQLPRILRENFSGSIIESYLERIKEAIDAETLDEELDRHLSWDRIPVDRQGWTEIMTRLDEVLGWLREVSMESAERMATSGEEPIPTTVGLGGFRSPKFDQPKQDKERRLKTSEP